ncbi:hypothetical protein ACXDF8_03435 [Mycolicibacterium sp. CBM1]
MSITQSPRIAARAIDISAAGLTLGAASAQADPGPLPCGFQVFQGCQAPGPGPASPGPVGRGPGGPPGDHGGPGPVGWQGPGGGRQWRGDD